MMTADQHLLPLALIVTSLFSNSLCCSGFSSYSSSSTDSNGPNGALFRKSTALARGASTAQFKSQQQGVAKCQQKTEAGAYRAIELRKLASLYQFSRDKNSQNQDLQLSCKFEANESCGWHNVEELPKPGELFQRAHIELPKLSWDKFECAGGGRTFPLEGFLLMVGGREQSVVESSAAIEAKVPCQLENAMLKFDYWSINETPVLKICVVPEEKLIPQCEESKMDVNPLTFEIPQNLRPFRLRIQVDNIVGKDDIVLIDNIEYDGNICENEQEKSKNAAKWERTKENGEEEFDIVKGEEEGWGEEEMSKKNRNEGQFGRHRTSEYLELLDPPVEEREEEEDTYDAKTIDDEDKAGTMLEDRRENIGNPEHYSNHLNNNNNNKNSEIRFSSIAKAKKFTHHEQQQQHGPDENNLCESMECDFNDGETCEFVLQGRESTSTWRVGNGPMGNPHTGIHKGNSRDPKLSGYAFVGSDSANPQKEMFVLESPNLRVDSPVLLVFDLFQRSVGPQLKVCLDALNNCPYENPPKPNKSQHWSSDQRVIVRQGTKKVYFVGSNLRQNLYIAIDNIRLQTMGFKELCTENNDK